MPNTFFYHGVAFVFPTLILIIFLSLTCVPVPSFRAASDFYDRFAAYVQELRSEVEADSAYQQYPLQQRFARL